MTEIVDRELVHKCLYNWLGYGNPNGKYWFIGTEEGYAEIKDEGNKNKDNSRLLTLEESLTIRSGFDGVMDLGHVWNDLYNYPLSSIRTSVWNYMAAMVLESEDIKITELSKVERRQVLKGFIAERLGRLESDHFLCEFYPLPKKNQHRIEPYQSIWKNIKAYYSELKTKRFRIVLDTLKENPKVEAIVCYDKEFSKVLLEQLDDMIDKGNVYKGTYTLKSKEKVFTIYPVFISPGRRVHFVSCPFFGNGNMSYEGISKIVESLELK